MSGIVCFCGEALPGLMPGQSVTCRCSVTYTATIDIGALYQRVREMARDMSNLAKLDPVAAMARPTKGDSR